MADSEFMACADTILKRLTAAGEVWGEHAFLHAAPEGTPTTGVFVTFSWTGGGEENRLVSKRDPTLIWNILAHSESFDLVSQAAARIATLLDDADLTKAGALPNLGGWVFKTVSIDQPLFRIEYIDGTRRVYAQGGRYRFTMEEV